MGHQGCCRTADKLSKVGWWLGGSEAQGEKSERTHLHTVYLCCLFGVGDDREGGGEREGLAREERVSYCGGVWKALCGLMCGGEGRASLLAGKLMSAAVFIARGFKDWEFDIYIHLQSECSS